mmetsp:Transcript_5718/g.16942  ORF Transcript_5718/g.16942 Transcript_5718/m.16942 type:complete len:252 (+) Transcript_5718:482-1237(+)
MRMLGEVALHESQIPCHARQEESLGVRTQLDQDLAIQLQGILVRFLTSQRRCEREVRWQLVFKFPAMRQHLVRDAISNLEMALAELHLGDRSVQTQRQAVMILPRIVQFHEIHHAVLQVRRGRFVGAKIASLLTDLQIEPSDEEGIMIHRVLRRVEVVHGSVPQPTGIVARLLVGIVQSTGSVTAVADARILMSLFAAVAVIVVGRIAAVQTMSNSGQLQQSMPHAVLVLIALPAFRHELQCRLLDPIMHK